MLLPFFLALTFPTNPNVLQSDPTQAYYQVKPGQGFDGVVLLELTDTGNETGYCTGSLLRSGQHILTAAHCVDPDQPAGINVVFELSHQVARSVRRIEWVADNPALARLELMTPAPAEATPGELYALKGGLKSCQGQLSDDRQSVLTAADCVDRDRPETLMVQLTWYERVARSVQTVHVHPDWQPEHPDAGNDIAILALTATAPAMAERYAIYRLPDERGQTFVRVGYGLTGSGVTGEIPSADLPQKRLGGNRYDAWGDILNLPPLTTTAPSPQAAPIPTLPGTAIAPSTVATVVVPPSASDTPMLVYDFDSGRRTHDALGRQYGVYDLGLLDYTGQVTGIWRPQNQIPLFNVYRPFPVLPMESGIGKGDSGSPAFIDGQIAGIASRQIQPTVPGADITGAVDGSFGEIFVDMRVSIYAEFIDGILNAAVRPADQR